MPPFAAPRRPTGPAERVGRPARWTLEAPVVAVLLLAAAFLRVWRMDLAQVNFDEAAAASLVADWKLRGLFPLTGIVSSVEIPNPPGWPYVLALGLLPSDDPLALVAVGVASGVLAVILVWWVARRWLGPWAALAALVFYGASFWSIMLGRSAWQPVFLQPLVLLALDAFLLLALRRRPWALAAVCGWLALMIHFHYVAAAYAVLLPFGVWRARHELRPVHYAGAVLVGLIPLAPMLLHQAMPGVRFHDVAGLLGIGSGAGGEAVIDLSAFALLRNVASTGGAAGLGSPSVDGLAEALGRWSSLSLVGPLLVVSGGLVALFVWPRGWLGGLLVAWTLVPVVVLSRHTVGVLFHYLWLDFPGLALLVGALAGWLTTRRLRIGLAAVVGTLGLYAVVSVATFATVLGYVDAHDAHIGYGVPVGYSRAAGEAVRANRQAGSPVLVGDDGRDGQVLRFAIGFDVPSSLFDDCRALPWQSNAVYVLRSEGTPGAALLAESGAPLLARVPRPGDAFVVYGAPPALPPAIDLTARPEYDGPTCRSRR